MNKLVVALLIVLALAAGIYLFRAPLMEAMMANLTSDMFVAADDDPYDPGIAVGSKLPPILALHDGSRVTDLAQFAGERGTALFVNRSVDW
ncbi:MAG: hypothetical protein HC809_12160 [Gammaproteobacteria bacterium]|nr:hypothetical protein [Gammaproteobacteria bacterium]